MHVVKSVTDYAKVRYGVDEPTKSQVNCVTELCRNGTIRHAQKMGNRWYIDCTAEWPSLFPDEDERQKVVYVEREPLITADMRLGDALAVLLDALIGKEVA